MKKSKISYSARRFLLSAILISPSLTFALDWDGTEGPFGTASNWDTDTVPSGTVAQIANGGTATVTTDDSFGITTLAVGGHSGTGALSFDGGTISATTRFMIGGDDAGGGTGVGAVTMTGGTLQATGGQESWIGTKGGSGTLTLSGSAIFSNNQQIHFGRDAGGTGTGTIGGNAQFTATRVGVGVYSGTTSTVTVKDSATFNTSSGDGALNVGWSGNPSLVTTGIFNIQDSATVNVTGQVRVGNEVAGIGTLAMTGGTLNLTSSDAYFVAGRNGGTGSATFSGTSDLNVERWFMAGAGGSGATGTITISGNATVDAQRVVLGWDNANNTGTVTIADNATVTTTQGVYINGGEGTGTRHLNLNGGTVVASQFVKSGGAAAIDINFNGGTIKASAMSSDFFSGIDSADMEIQSGGLEFDTDIFDIVVLQNLNGDGGFAKLGTGSLFFLGANGYFGDTTVEAGTLSLSSISLADTSSVHLTTGSIFDLAFEGIDTVSGLFIDGIFQAPGTWGGAGSGAEHISPMFSGTGLLLVAVPEPSTIALGIAGAFALVCASRRKRI